MYDDLARSQRRGWLERLVVNAVIPSVLATFVMHAGSLSGRRENLNLSGAYLVPFLTPSPVDETWSAAFWCIRNAHFADDTPIILAWTEIGWPGPLEGRVPGCVVLEAALTPSGRVDRGSILVVSATSPLLVIPARRTLMKEQFLLLQNSREVTPNRVRVPFEFAVRVR